MENHNNDKSKTFKAEILKYSDEQRLVYGWGYVSTINGNISLDHSNEFIRPDTIEKAATDFMVNARVAKAMHQGPPVGEVIHSLPITKGVADALGIQSDREGWIIAVKVYDDSVWNLVKTGKLTSFSIGGLATKEHTNAD